MIPLNRRIRYDDSHGCWRVIWDGKTVAQEFKTSTLAMAHLEDISRGKIDPSTLKYQ